MLTGYLMCTFDWEKVVSEVAHNLCLQDGLRVFNLEPIREKAHYTEDQVAQKYPRISQLEK